MQFETEFSEMVANAYEHFYDLVYLRTHPLIEALNLDFSRTRKENSWQLHDILLRTIEELDPGPRAPAFSYEWRRHRLAVLRYIDGLDPTAVASQLNISRRHFYREQKKANEALAKILWQRYVASRTPSQVVPQKTMEKDTSLSRLELLRQEATHMGQHDICTRIGGVIDGVLRLFQQTLTSQNLEVAVTLPQPSPDVLMNEGLLRQMLVGMFGYLIEQADTATIRLSARAEAATFFLNMTVDPTAAVHPMPQPAMKERIRELEEMAVLCNLPIHVSSVDRKVIGFELQLPIGRRHTVLVVDDNHDVLELFERYLTLHQYEVVTAETAHEALTFALQLHPDFISLDLMMPDQDGWDVLQTLLNQPETCHIPIMVCSVLRQKDLALMLGATTFLEKPITEDSLLTALGELETAYRESSGVEARI